MENEILIKVGLDKNKVASGIKTAGYDDNNIHHQFELLGIMVNLQWIIQQRIIKLGGLNNGIRS